MTKILVVDDEHSLRKFSMLMLNAQGYEAFMRGQPHFKNYLRQGEIDMFAANCCNGVTLKKEEAGLTGGRVT